MRAAIVVSCVIGVAGACGGHVPSVEEARASRARELEGAFARAQARVGGDEITVDQVVVERAAWMNGPEPDEPGGADAAAALPVRVDARVAGQGGDDVLYRVRDGRLALAAPTCLRGSSCGCEIGIDYRFLRRADGHVAVVRLMPQVETVKVEVESCGYGCGVPAPPQPATAALLPVTDAGAIEVIDAPYRYVDVVPTCAHPVPRP